MDGDGEDKEAGCRLGLVPAPRQTDGSQLRDRQTDRGIDGRLVAERGTWRLAGWLYNEEEEEDDENEPDDDDDDDDDKSQDSTVMVGVLFVYLFILCLFFVYLFVQLSVVHRLDRPSSE